MPAMLALVVAVLLWVNCTEAFSLMLYHIAPPQYALVCYQYGGLIFGVALMFGVCLIGSLTDGLDGKPWSDAIWNSKPGRRLIGLFASGCVLWAVAAPVYGLMLLLIGNHAAAGAMGCAVAWFGRRRVKIFIGRSTRPIRWLLAGRHAGMGGSARFSGLFDEWANPWQPGQILLGRSRYDPRWLVGMTDDRHVCTIATSRAGKGRSQIIPNLLTWPGSAIVIDPKGQNACVTALRRGPGGAGLSSSLGQSVRILDPLGEIKDPALKPLLARFNPLSALDPSVSNYVERVRTIADALVVPSAKDDFFDNAARGLIAGVVDYVVRAACVEDHERTLATVRGLLVHPDGLPLDDMDLLGGLSQAGAAGLKRGGENSTADVLFTAMTHTDWLDSASMQDALSVSEFDLTDLNQGNTTIYLVLPPQYLDIHARFLRLFINLTLKSAADGRKGQHATLFLLDEFYALGTLQLLAKAAGLLAGYGVKLWPILQNIGQLQELYPKNWETFLGNAGIWTVFAINDASTARYLSERLGRRILWRKMRGPDGYDWEIAGGASLRDTNEFQREISRQSETVGVFTESGEAFLLERANYDGLFQAHEYSPDLMERERRAA